MLFGTGTFAELPFSSSNPNDGSVTINVTGNVLTLSLGVPTVTGDAANVIIANDPLILGSGSVVVTGDANITVSGNPLTLNSALVVASTSVDITVPGNPLTLRSQTVNITGGANIDVSGNALTITCNDVGVITWNPIIPGATNVWIPIEPY
jgi:lipopolysaccharide export system protein LptA